MLLTVLLLLLEVCLAQEEITKPDPTLDPLERYRGPQPIYFYIQSLDSKLVLDLDDKNPCANAQIILCPKVEGKQSQIWSYQGSLLLKNNHSGYFMDVKGGKIPGSRVITWPEYNSLNQQWVFQEQTGTFLNGMNLVLDVENAKRMPGSPLIAFPYHGGMNQRFKRIQIGINYTALTNEFKP